MKTSLTKYSWLQLGGYALFALSALCSAKSWSAEAVPTKQLECRSPPSAGLVEISEQDVQAFVKSGVVPARLTRNLTIGSVNKPTLWMSDRRRDSKGYIAAGFAAERYEELTLEVFGASIPASSLQQLIAAVVGDEKSPRINAVMVSASSVLGKLDLSTTLPVSTSLRLGFIDSDLGDLSLQSPNVLGSGIHFEREVSFQCVQAQTIGLTSATFSRPMVMTRVRVESINGINANFLAGIELSEVSAKSLDFDGARFGGERGLSAVNVEAKTFDLQGTRISHGDLRHATITERLDLARAVVDGSLVVTEARLGESGKENWLHSDDASVSLNEASLGSLRLSEVAVPRGISLENVRAGGIFLQLAETALPNFKRDPNWICSPELPRVSLHNTQVVGWLRINGTDHLNLDLSDTRATYLDVRSIPSAGRAPKYAMPIGCLSVARLNAPHQFWADPFPYALNRLVDMSWRGDLNAFRAQLEKHAGKSRADAWYREAREANSSGFFDRRIRGDLLAYGTKPVPPLPVALIVLLTLFVAFVSWRTDALEFPAQSFWTTRFGRPLAHFLFAVRTLTPFAVVDAKPRPGVHWHGISFELIAAVTKVLGLILLGGLLIAWAGYF